jgi:glycosyltransferase 2 family protein
MNRLTRAALSAGRVLIAVALLAWLAGSGDFEWRRLGRLVPAWPLTAAAIAVYVASAMLAAWRLVVLLRPFHMTLSFFSSFRLTLIGSFFNVCLPGAVAGDLMRMYYVCGDKTSGRAELATLIFVDRLAGLFAVVTAPVVLAPMFPALIASSAILQTLVIASGAAAAAVATLFFLVTSDAACEKPWFNRALARLPLHAYIERVLATMRLLRHERTAVAGAVGLSLAIHALATTVILILAAAVAPQGADARMALLVPMGFLANQVPITPSGFGVGEAVFSNLFAISGLRGGAELMLAWRVVMIAVSFGGLYFYLEGRRHFIESTVAVPEYGEKVTV